MHKSQKLENSSWNCQDYKYIISIVHESNSYNKLSGTFKSQHTTKLKHIKRQSRRQNCGVLVYWKPKQTWSTN